MLRQLICIAAVLALQQHNFAAAAGAADLPTQAAKPAAAGAADLPTQAAKPAIICVGDGLTEGAFSHKHEGWGLLMQERYVRKADVVNRGFGGYFTSWFVDYMLEDLFNVANPTMVVLFLGTKDTLTPAVSGNHYISPQQFAANVDRIIQKAKAVGVKHFLIISPPPVCEVCKKDKPKPWDRENAHSRQYVEQLKSLADKHKAGLVNIFEEWQKDPTWADKLLLPDKLHLSNQGNQLLWKQMQEAIAAQVPPMAWENVALHYPLMDAIDKDHPSQAFDKVVRSQVKNNLKDDSSSSSALSISRNSNGYSLEQGQQRSSARGLPTSGLSLLLVCGVLLAAWQLYSL